MPQSKITNYTAWDDFKLVCRKTLHTDSTNTPGEHCHRNFFELVTVVSGRGKHRTANGEWLIQPGNVFLIKPMQMHCYSEYENLVIYNLLFSARFISLTLPDLHLLPGFQLLFNLAASKNIQADSGNLHINKAVFPEVVALLEEMNDLNYKLPPGGKTLLISNFTRAMHLIANHVQWSASDISVSHIEQISSLLSELQKSFNAPWTLEKWQHTAA